VYIKLDIYSIALQLVTVVYFIVDYFGFSYNRTLHLLCRSFEFPVVIIKEMHVTVDTDYKKLCG